MATNNSVIISYNKEAVGIEVRIPDGRRLTQSELAEVKALKLSWHHKKRLWYTRFSEEKMDAIKKSFLGKEATFPKAADTKELAKLAAEKAAQTPAKKAKSPKTSETLAEMQAQIAALTQMLLAQQAASNATATTTK